MNYTFLLYLIIRCVYNNFIQEKFIILIHLHKESFDNINTINWVMK